MHSTIVKLKSRNVALLPVLLMHVLATFLFCLALGHVRVNADDSGENDNNPTLQLLPSVTLNNSNLNEVNTGTCINEYSNVPHDVLLAIDSSNGPKVCGNLVHLLKENSIELLLGVSILTYPTAVDVSVLPISTSTDDVTDNNDVKSTSLIKLDEIKESILEGGCPHVDEDNGKDETNNDSTSQKLVVPNKPTWNESALKTVVVVTDKPSASLDDYDLSKHDLDTTSVILMKLVDDGKHHHHYHHPKDMTNLGYQGSKIHKKQNHFARGPNDNYKDVIMELHPSGNVLSNGCKGLLADTNTVTLNGLVDYIQKTSLQGLIPGLKKKNLRRRDLQTSNQNESPLDNNLDNNSPSDSSNDSNVATLDSNNPGVQCTTVTCLLLNELLGNDGSVTDDILNSLLYSVPSASPGMILTVIETNPGNSEPTAEVSETEYSTISNGNSNNNGDIDASLEGAIVTRSEGKGPYPPGHPHYKGPDDHSHEHDHEKHDHEKHDHEKHDHEKHDHEKHEHDHKKHEHEHDHDEVLESQNYADGLGVGSETDASASNDSVANEQEQYSNEDADAIKPIISYPYYDEETNTYYIPQDDGKYVYYSFDDPALKDILKNNFPGLVSLTDLSQLNAMQNNLFDQNYINAEGETPATISSGKVNEEIAQANEVTYEKEQANNELVDSKVVNNLAEESAAVNASAIEVPVNADFANNGYASTESEKENEPNELSPSGPIIGDLSGNLPGVDSSVADSDIYDDSLDEESSTRAVYIVPGVSAMAIVSGAAAATYFYKRRSHRNATRQVDSNRDFSHNRVNPLYNPPVSQISNPLYINPGSNIN